VVAFDLSTEESEVWALLFAMSEANRGLERVKFEYDSHVLVEAIRTKRKTTSSFIQFLMILLLLCHHVQVNLVAHISLHRFECILLCIEHLLFDQMN
jgi:hypothetical protein